MSIISTHHAINKIVQSLKINFTLPKLYNCTNKIRKCKRNKTNTFSVYTDKILCNFSLHV